MPDIWLPLVNHGRVDEVRRIQANVGAHSIYFWGQELRSPTTPPPPGERWMMPA